jgi:hypothetical protein
MPARKTKRPESVSARIARLSLIPEWRIVVRYYERDTQGRPTHHIAESHYPPPKVSPYSYTEAVAMLKTFCSKWTQNGQHPPPNLEPRAIEINDDPRNASKHRRPLLQFVLKDVLTHDDDGRQLIPAEVPRNEEGLDAADRWLQENE